MNVFDVFEVENFFRFLVHRDQSRGESVALSRRMLWANRLFSKSMNEKILNFLHEVEKMISVIYVQV